MRFQAPELPGCKVSGLAGFEISGSVSGFFFFGGGGGEVRAFKGFRLFLLNVRGFLVQGFLGFRVLDGRDLARFLMFEFHTTTHEALWRFVDWS